MALGTQAYPHVGLSWRESCRHPVLPLRRSSPHLMAPSLSPGLEIQKVQPSSPSMTLASTTSLISRHFSRRPAWPASPPSLPSITSMPLARNKVLRTFQLHTPRWKSLARLLNMFAITTESQCSQALVLGLERMCLPDWQEGVQNLLKDLSSSTAAPPPVVGWSGRITR